MRHKRAAQAGAICSFEDRPYVIMTNQAFVDLCILCIYR